MNQPKEIKKLPKCVDRKTYQVYMNDFCDIPMEYSGKDDLLGHEYHCSDVSAQCPFAGTCNQIRHIPVDTGVFGQIPYHFKEARQLCDMRKVAERPFNLLKHREGL